MSLSRKRSTLSYMYCMGNETISRTTIVKDLGVFVDDHLSFNSHINSIVSQSLRMLGIMARLTRPFSTHHCLLRLFSTHVRSRLEFASVIWNSISSTASEKIEHIQKRFVRIVYDRYFGRKCYFQYNLILSKLKLCALHNRRSVRDVKFLHRLIHGSIDSPSLLASLHFRIPVSANSRNLRVFYPDIHSNLSPISRIQHVLDTKFCNVDIFCTKLPLVCTGLL
uniref:Putative rna-directed dna polymerase from mobile element jockey-like protein n=1 Tax=Ixodes ricinus TaxID=34613 RepID=A0A131XU11_IXORI